MEKVKKKFRNRNFIFHNGYINEIDDLCRSLNDSINNKCYSCFFYFFDMKTDNAEDLIKIDIEWKRDIIHCCIESQQQKLIEFLVTNVLESRIKCANYKEPLLYSCVYYRSILYRNKTALEYFCKQKFFPFYGYYGRHLFDIDVYFDGYEKNFIEVVKLYLYFIKEIYRNGVDTINSEIPKFSTSRDPKQWTKQEVIEYTNNNQTTISRCLYNRFLTRKEKYDIKQIVENDQELQNMLLTHYDYIGPYMKNEHLKRIINRRYEKEYYVVLEKELSKDIIKYIISKYILW